MNVSSESSASSLRQVVGLLPDEGPSDLEIDAAVNGFTEQFEYWFTRVIADAVHKYRQLIVRRINSFIRPIEFDGLATSDVASRLVSDYVNRNFVTAGGWAIEKMALAIAGSVGASKASSRGIDIERTDASGNRHLYVLKSGKVTRNSDILSKLKQHAKDAEKLIRQGGSKVGVFANYVVAAGNVNSTFEDGINRPSSGTFWAEITGLPEDKALSLVSAIARTAGKMVTRNTDVHIGALVTLVQDYIASREDADKVDWEYLFKITMTEKPSWAAEDTKRHKSASAVLEATGYKLTPASSRPSKVAKKGATPLSKKGKLARGMKKE